jgi:hypothetical protein
VPAFSMADVSVEVPRDSFETFNQANVEEIEENRLAGGAGGLTEEHRTSSLERVDQAMGMHGTLPLMLGIFGVAFLIVVVGVLTH